VRRKCGLESLDLLHPAAFLGSEALHHVTEAGIPEGQSAQEALKLGIFIESTERESWKGWVDFREQERLAENLELIADVNL